VTNNLLRRFHLRNGVVLHETDSESIDEILTSVLTAFHLRSADDAKPCIFVEGIDPYIFLLPDDEVASIAGENCQIFAFFASDDLSEDRLVLWEGEEGDQQKFLVVDENGQNWQTLPISGKRVRMFKSPEEARTALQDVNQNIGL
jgi:hypothetical protein